MSRSRGWQRPRQEKAVTDLRDVETRITELSEQQRALEIKITRLDLRAPCDGIVQSLQIRTIGAVTQTARLWAYGRDERPWGSAIPPASWYRFSSDRKGECPKDHLSGYRGWMTTA